MSERRKYKVIVSDRAKQMLGVHIRFLAQVDKDAARNKKKELMEAMPQCTVNPITMPPIILINAHAFTLQYTVPAPYSYFIPFRK